MSTATLTNTVTYDPTSTCDVPADAGLVYVRPARAPSDDRGGGNGQSRASAARCETETVAAVTAKGTSVSPGTVADCPLLAEPLPPRGPVIVRRPVPPIREKERLIQHWEGTVVSTTRKTFVAQLSDVMHPDMPALRVTLDTDEVSDDDLPLIRPGAIFDWTISHQTRVHGQKDTLVRIRFRRLPAWSKRDLQRVREDARRYDELFADDG
jgi:hypothetical protein